MNPKRGTEYRKRYPYFEQQMILLRLELGDFIALGKASEELDQMRAWMRTLMLALQSGLGAQIEPQARREAQAFAT